MSANFKWAGILAGEVVVFAIACPCFGQSVVSGRNSPAPAKQNSPLIIRERTDLVTLNVMVTDRDGNAIYDLAPSELEIYEDSVLQTIEHYGISDLPLSIGAVFDLSGSMTNKLDVGRAALGRFIETSHSDDDYFLIGFNRQAKLLAEFSDGRELKDRLKLFDPEGGTALYDAIYLGIEKIKYGHHHRRRALLIISDGQDNASRYGLDQVRRRLKESDVLLYCIGIVRPGMSEKAEQREQHRGQIILDDLAQLTGGRAIFVSSVEDLDDAMSRVAVELRQQYTIGYSSTNQSRDGKWRKIHVRARRDPDQPKVYVRTREGYYGPAF
jgi:Ca-activated chloride channel family protein